MWQISWKINILWVFAFFVLVDDDWSPYQHSFFPVNLQSEIGINSTSEWCLHFLTAAKTHDMVKRTFFSYSFSLSRLFVLISFLGIMTNENNTICDNFLWDKSFPFSPAGDFTVFAPPDDELESEWIDKNNQLALCHTQMKLFLTHSFKSFQLLSAIFFPRPIN